MSRGEQEEESWQESLRSCAHCAQEHGAERTASHIGAAHSIAHNKVMVIDKAVVITGSFNFTKAAEGNNAENLLVLRSKELASGYIENWWRHKEHSDRYRGR